MVKKPIEIILGLVVIALVGRSLFFISYKENAVVIMNSCLTEKVNLSNVKTESPCRYEGILRRTLLGDYYIDENDRETYFMNIKDYTIITN